MTTYEKFTTCPAWTQAVWTTQGVANASDPVKWGGKVEPPAIGTKVLITMNQLGRGTVRGYFVEHGWLASWSSCTSRPRGGASRTTRAPR